MKLSQHRVEHASPIVILGAGLSGLSLADALAHGGCRAPIVLIDRRRRWEEDRTWCTWLTGPLRYAELARHRWFAWELRRGAQRTLARTERHPYVHLAADAVYDRALTNLDACAGIEIRTGERVLGIGGSGPRPILRTTRETFEAELVIDAMGARSPLLAREAPADPALAQRFLGWEVETDGPVFDTACATLMDFRAAGPTGVDFLYRLPFSGSRALLEHTSIGRADHGPDARARREALTAEVDRLAGPGRWRVLREERGSIPMTAQRFPLAHRPGVLTVGGAAGAIRPSSGYAFTRIQRHVSAVAAAILAGAPAPDAVAPRRLARLDRAFLAALATAPDGGESLFWTLARGVDADAFARFMTDASTAADEAQIIAALPPLPMIRAALRSLVAAPP